jgi:hypothetical protein
MKFGVVEQMPFKNPAGTKILSDMAPTKSNDRILPITEPLCRSSFANLNLMSGKKNRQN